MKRKVWDEKKVYTSFHDIPPRDYMYFPKGSIEVCKPGKFSSIEIKQLIISMTVLTIAFAFALTNNNVISGLSNGFNFDILPYGLLLSFLGIVTAFFFHELSHKLIAQKYGLWAEYRMFPQGLALALVLGLFTPFVFAAPGAVMFRGGSRDFETGKIAMAGPLANIIISLVALMIFLYIAFEDSIFGPILGFICMINAFLAVFNLLPFGPLDGTKIIRWNPTVWIFMLIISIAILTTISPKLSLIF
jgi:Zn-dependent protease